MKTFIFEINLLSGPRPPRKVSREIEIPEFFTLYQLAGSINDAYGFAFDHPFGFYSNLDPSKYHYSEKKYDLFTDMPEKGMDIEPTGAGSVKKTTIDQVWKKAGDKMLFLFDYGDCWHFVVELKGFGWQPRGNVLPIILKKTGKTPRQY